MPDLNFQVVGAKPLEHAAAPTLVFQLQIAASGGLEPIENILLQCQLQFEVNRRRYSPAEQERLEDLFGTPERWGETLRPMTWTRASVIVPGFERAVTADLQVPCTFDFNIAATKYFEGLEDGEVPLMLLFSGSVFYRDEHDTLRVTQIPWSKEARYRLPVRVWREMMEHYYPNSAWLRLRRDLFERVARFRRDNLLPSWDAVVERLLDEIEEGAPA